MAQITAALVKQLRDKTGAGMMDSKKALTETDGDFEAAVDWLRAKGLSKAAKKSGRVAADGLIGVAVKSVEGGQTGAVVEVNAETDFVARNATFQAFVTEVAELALNAGESVDDLLKATMATGSTVEATLTEMIATIGENMTVRRVARLTAGPGSVVPYMHGAVADNLGRIGVIVALKSSGDAAVVAETAKQIALHVAAAAPIAARVEEVDPAVAARERAVFEEQARESGKPAGVIEKMVDGRMAKFFAESVLLKQPIVMDNKTPVETVIAQAAEKAGAPIEFVGFQRFALGDGVEKAEDDFAAEVAAAAGQG